ncbi:hypothetical protein BGZ81_010860 [Podila clonocystis]|nr:hypothetical protein BGZ81_010860 [Podila clonocystis]
MAGEGYFSDDSDDDIIVKPCIRTMEFSLEASATTGVMTLTYDAGSRDYLRLYVTPENKGFSFSVTPCPLFIGSYTLKTPSGTCLSSGSLAQGHRHGLYEIVLARNIPLDKLEVINGRFKIVVCLSNQEHVASAHSKHVAPDPAASFLDRLYHDTDSRDVSFIFSNPDSPTTETNVEKAHKLILHQWPYFRRMFSSDFMEGGAGEKEIQIKGVKPKVFQMLLRFMYNIPIAEQPLVAFTETVANPRDASWEDIFLAAHRYELEELCALAQKNIIEKLTPQVAIPFLFRTGYLFETLRAPTISYIASTSASQVASKSLRDSYQDHPEFGDLLFEFFKEYHSTVVIQPKQQEFDYRGSSCRPTQI